MVTKAQVLAEITARPGRGMSDISHRLKHGNEPFKVAGKLGAPDYPSDVEVDEHIRRLVGEGTIYATGKGYELV